MSNSQPEESIGFLISDVSRLLRRNFDKRAQKIGLSRAQWQVLAWLKRNEGSPRPSSPTSSRCRP